jgi:CDGSH-type Zn-finger protein
MTKIILYEDGPIIISNENSKVALCRCGQTKNAQGFCDSNHAKCGFKAIGAEVKLGEHISLEIPEC